MKKLLLTLFLFWLTTQTFSQSIVSFAVSPVNPTTADTIHVIIEYMFPSGGCDGAAMLAGINGDQILVDASHCLGMLTVICTDYDTITLPPLSQGQYNFIVTLQTGDGLPCVPGTFPIVIDSVSIQVSGTSGTSIPATSSEFNIFPNPGDGIIHFTNNTSGKLNVSIFNTLGQHEASYTIFSKAESIDLTGLGKGFYIISIADEKRNVINRKILID